MTALLYRALKRRKDCSSASGKGFTGTDREYLQAISTLGIESKYKKRIAVALSFKEMSGFLKDVDL